MRIISGHLKGRKIETLRHKDLRPTTNKIKERIFNILEHNPNILADQKLSDIETMLDICSGIGSIAFEAISRGVQNAILIDKNRLFGELTEFNASKFGVSDRVKFLNYNALNLPKAMISVDLCFMDPPYNQNITDKVLTELIKKNWLNDKAIVIIESAKKTSLNFPINFEQIDKREDGITKLYFLKYNKLSTTED
jgi:16S rRNA (guanine966-N2)-methyltransferase